MRQPQTEHSTSPLSVEGIPKHSVVWYWDAVRPFIESALKYESGEREPDDILTAILRRDAQLWIVKDPMIVGVAVTEVIQYPRAKFVLVDVFAGQEMARWFEVWHESIRNWAKEQGADGLKIMGRKGWSRRLREHCTSEQTIMVERF